MRVLLLLNARFPTEKAYGIQIMAMARGFVQAGADVVVVYPRRTREQPKKECGIIFQPYGPLRELRWPWLFPLFRVLGVMEAVKPLRNFAPDIVFANDPVQAAFLASRFPVIWELHDMPNPHSVWRRWLVRRICRRVRGIVSTNQLKIDAIRSIASHLPQTIILPNPISIDPSVYRTIKKTTARNSLGLGMDGKVIVYAGQLYMWKGVDTLISSAAFAPASVQMHIVGGSGTDLERCRKLVAGLPSHAVSVILHGQKPPEDIPRWLRAADIIAIPNSGKFELSQRDTNPLKLYEAFAAEAPILASDLPSIREAVGESMAVRFIAADDPRAWGTAMSELFSDPSKLEHMRQAAQVFGGLLRPVERAMRLLVFFTACLA